MALTILEDADGVPEGVLLIKTRVTNTLLQTGLDESLLFLSQTGNSLREVCDEPPHGNSNEAGKSTLCDIQVSTALIFRGRYLPSRKIHHQVAQLVIPSISPMAVASTLPKAPAKELEVNNKL